MAGVEDHLGGPGGPKRTAFSGRFARRCVRRRIILAEIRFGFDNSSRQNSARRFPDQQLAEQRPRHAPRITIEELRFQQSHSTTRRFIRWWSDVRPRLSGAEVAGRVRPALHWQSRRISHAPLFKYATPSSPCPPPFTLLKFSLTLPPWPHPQLIPPI